MQLNKDEILAEDLILDGNPDNYRATSYDISIGDIISREGEILPYYYLKPQGIIQVISLEKFKLPQDITGYVMIKTSLSNEGILPLNIGIIDPGYEGYISAIILNFSRNSFLLERGSVFLRTTFHKSKMLNQPIPSKAKNILGQNSNGLYIQEKRKKVKQFSNDFLNLQAAISNEANKIAIKYFAIIVAISAFLFVVSPLVVTIATQLVAQHFSDSKSTMDKMEKRINKLEKELYLLRKRVK